MLSLLSSLLAGAVLVLFVLPAERGIDRTGIGRLLGLTALAAPPSPLRGERLPLRRDLARRVLGPLESVEYAYTADAGNTLVYALAASAPVRFDFHGAPVTQPDAAVSYSHGQRTVEQGSLQAPVTGVHAFYIENNGNDEVTVTLQVAGFYSAASEYFDGRVYPRDNVGP